MLKRIKLVTVFLAILWLEVAGNAAEKVAEPEYFTVRRENYPCTMHVVKVPRKDRRWEIRSLHAEGRALGLENLSAQIRRPKDVRAVAAVNGDYYVRQGFFGGDPRGLQIMGTELISAPTEGASFWIDALDQPNIGVTTARFSVEWPNGSTAPFELNTAGTEDGVVLYTPGVGSQLVSRGGVELILEREGSSLWLPLRPGRVYSAKVREQRKGNIRLAADQLVLSIGRRAGAPKIEMGAIVKINTATEPSLRGVAEAISGGPILVRDGKRMPIKARNSDSYIFSSMTESHPRSAIGWNENYYFLVSADGRHGNISLGLTLEEFGAELLKIGCENALNLDGGGSATLWYQGKVVNYLCDGYERKIANVLSIVEKN